MGRIDGSASEPSPPARHPEKKKPVFQLGAYKPLVVVGGRVEQQVPENLFVGPFDGRRLLRSVLFADPFQLL
jgi:hypothetical protein